MPLTKVSYSMIAGSPVNIIDFGADPTGVADSTSAIQSAIDARNNVYLPAGTYKVSSTLNVQSGVVLTGESAESVVISYTGAWYCLYLRGPVGSEYINNAVIQNITLTGTASASDAIHGDPIVYCKFVNLVINGFGGNGIVLNGSYFNEINGCNIRGNTGNGIVIQNSSNANTIIATSSTENGDNGIRFLDSSGLTLVQFDAETNGGYGIVVEGSTEMYMHGGWLEANLTGGIRAFTSAASNVAKECYLSGSYRSAGATPSIKLESTEYFSISNAKCAGLISIDAGCSYTQITDLLDPLYCNNASSTTTYNGLPLGVGSSVTGPNDALIPLGYGSLKTVVWTGSSAVSTGINVNAGNGGKAIFALLSSQAGSGNAVSSSIYMIRCGYNGNNFTATKISGDDGGLGAGSSTYTFSQSSGVLYVQAAGDFNCRMTMILNTAS